VISVPASSWSVVAALSSLTSTVVIAITAVFALGQLNLMRRVGQFDATRRMVDEIKTPTFMRAWTQQREQLGRVKKSPAL
jgi:hypothetical protein